MFQAKNKQWLERQMCRKENTCPEKNVKPSCGPMECINGTYLTAPNLVEPNLAESNRAKLNRTESSKIRRLVPANKLYLRLHLREIGRLVIPPFTIFSCWIFLIWRITIRRIRVIVNDRISLFWWIVNGGITNQPITLKRKRKHRKSLLNVTSVTELNGIHRLPYWVNICQLRLQVE